MKKGKDSKVYAESAQEEEVDELRHKIAELSRAKNELEREKQSFELENAGLKAKVASLSGDELPAPEEANPLGRPIKLPEIVPPEEKAGTEPPAAAAAGSGHNLPPVVTSKQLMKRAMVAASASKPTRKEAGPEFSNLPTYIIHQNHPYKVRWDVLLAAMIIYSVITVPMRIAFETEAKGVALAIDIMIDVFFFADICASFRTTYIDPETHEYVSDYNLIAKHYLQNWFLIDFVSTLPIDRLATIGSSGGGGNLRIIKLIRVLRLVRLLKLMKLMKFGEILDQYENYLPVSRGVLQICGMLVQITFCAHLMGCLWYALGTMDCYSNASDKSTENDGCSWITDYYGTDWRLVPLQRRYTASIYWAVTTMATVGYGDINTQNDKERGFAVFAMCVGASAFGYTIGIISDLVQNSDIVLVEKRAKMNQFVNYSIDRHLPYPMAKRVKKHWAYLCEKEGVFQEAEMLSYMPLELQRDTIKTKGGAYRELCLQVEGLLTNGPGGIKRTPQFVLAVIPRLVPLYCNAGEVLFEEYMVGWHVYYIISGNVKLDVHVDGVKVSWKEIGPGSRFGENFVTDGSVALYTATAIEDTEETRVEMTSLDREDVMELAATFPELLDELKEGTENVDKELKMFKDSANAHESAANAPDVPAPLGKHERGELTATEVEADREKGIFHNMSAAQLWAKHHMVHPETMRKIQWDLIVGVMIVWSVVVVPMRIAFNVEPRGGMLVLDILIDVCFGIDLFMSFRTAFFTSHRELIYDSWRVTKNYLQGWFTIDFVTTFPIDRVAAAFVSNPAQLRSIKMLRVLRLARLAKIGKILQNGPMFELFEDLTAGINPSIFKLMKYFLEMFMCAHFIGCIWHYVCNFESASWASSYYSDPNFDDDASGNPNHWEQTNLQSRYLTSVYWALATMTTVGYGDISAHSDSEMEMVVAMFSMLFGTTIFAYVIGEVVMAVLNFNPAEKELGRKKRSLKKFIEHFRLAPKGVGMQADEEPDLDHVDSADMAARKGLMYSVEMTSVFDTNTLFKRTPEFLQRQLIDFHYSEYIERSPMLTKLERMFNGILVHIFPVLRPILVSADVDIVTKGDRISSMYLLQEGECRVREHESYIPGLAGGHTGVLPEGVSSSSEPNVRNDDDVFANRKKYEFLPGDYFMEHAVFIPEGSHCRAQLSVRAAGNTKTKLMELRRSDFMKLQDVCPVAFEFLRSKWNHPNDEWTVWSVPEKSKPK